MANQSTLDRKYFIDNKRYNCPFCNSRSVVYSVNSREEIDWTDNIKAWAYRVTCGGCDKTSIHLSHYKFSQFRHQFGTTPYFQTKPEDQDGNDVKNYAATDLDNFFFYHQPTSFFTINSLIPSKIRELVAEADGCRKMNFLIGASGALRKAIYELLKHQKAEGTEYQDKIKWLKTKYPYIFSEYFDALANIQDMTSDNLHEKDGSWKPWSRNDFDYFLETTKAVLEEIYVKPEERKIMLSKIITLKSKSTLSPNPKIQSNRK
jgi:hypothetical protein